MVTECIRGDHRPLAPSREGNPTVLCREHVDLVQRYEDHDLSGDTVVLDHQDAQVFRAYLREGLVSFSQGSGVGVG